MIISQTFNIPDAPITNSQDANYLYVIENPAIIQGLDEYACLQKGIPDQYNEIAIEFSTQLAHHPLFINPEPSTDTDNYVTDNLTYLYKTYDKAAPIGLPTTWVQPQYQIPVTIVYLIGRPNNTNVVVSKELAGYIRYRYNLQLDIAYDLFRKHHPMRGLKIPNDTDSNMVSITDDYYKSEEIPSFGYTLLAQYNGYELSALFIPGLDENMFSDHLSYPVSCPLSCLLWRDVASALTKTNTQEWITIDLSDGHGI